MALQPCCDTMQAWQLASPVAEPYREFAERWGNADFSKYVDILEQNADEAIQDADEVHCFSNCQHLLSGFQSTFTVLQESADFTTRTRLSCAAVQSNLQCIILCPLAALQTIGAARQEECYSGLAH